MVQIAAVELVNRRVVDHGQADRCRRELRVRSTSRAASIKLLLVHGVLALLISERDGEAFGRIVFVGRVIVRHEGTCVPSY